VSDSGEPFWQFVRYVINGVVATAVHYAILRIGLEVSHLHQPAWQISRQPCSGSRCPLQEAVISCSARRASRSCCKQASLPRFMAPSSACIMLFVWTDLWGLDYSLGFALAVIVQVFGSYFGNRYLVFATGKLMRPPPRIVAPRPGGRQSAERL